MMTAKKITKLLARLSEEGIDRLELALGLYRTLEGIEPELLPAFTADCIAEIRRGQFHLVQGGKGPVATTLPIPDQNR